MDWRRRMRIARREAARPFVRGIAPTVLRALARTWNTVYLGEEHLAAATVDGGGCFMALWHGRMILSMPGHAHRDWQVLVSPSDDGDLSQSLLERFGYGVIRGSSSRGGARALRVMLEHLDRGEVLVITPDGPRGPRHSTNPGLAWMARATGRAIVPCGFVCDRAWRARSWDRLAIPKARARVALVYGAPVRVAREGGDAELERATALVRERMLAAERRGFAHLGVEGDHDGGGER